VGWSAPLRPTPLTVRYSARPCWDNEITQNHSLSAGASGVRQVVTA
jgi:hypothetical protein